MDDGEIVYGEIPQELLMPELCKLLSLCYISLVPELPLFFVSGQEEIRKESTELHKLRKTTLANCTNTQVRAANIQTSC
jgi:hypothetical protein